MICVSCKSVRGQWQWFGRLVGTSREALDVCIMKVNTALVTCTIRGLFLNI